jgi:hypothetical protein
MQRTMVECGCNLQPSIQIINNATTAKLEKDVTITTAGRRSEENVVVALKTIH